MTVQESLQEFAALAVARGQPDAAARLLGASERVRRELGVAVWDAADLERTTSSVRSSLGEQRFRDLSADGAALDPEDAIELARSID